MKLPSFKRFSREDFQDAPPWIEKLLTPLNQFFEYIYLANDKNLDGDNLAIQTREVKFTTDSTYPATFSTLTFPRELKTKSFGLSLVSIAATDGSVITSTVGVPIWTDINGTIKVTYLSGLTASKEYVARFKLE